LSKVSAGALVRWWSARVAVLRWGAVALGTGILWWSSAQSGNPLGDSTAAEFVHNGAHVVAYGSLAALALAALAPPESWHASQVATAVLIAGCYGVVDEIHQHFVPGRTCSAADAITDVVGGSLACCWLLGHVADRPAARRAVPAMVLAALAAVAFATWGPL
jgi:VanZ family protein